MECFEGLAQTTSFAFGDLVIFQDMIFQWYFNSIHKVFESIILVSDGCVNKSKF